MNKLATKQVFDYELKDIKKLALFIEDLIKHNNQETNFILLDGDLSSGKTTFVKSFIALHSDKIVTSPTFCVLQEYEDNIYHYDLYQKTWNELLALGVLDFTQNKGIHFVEWPSLELRNGLKQMQISPINIKIQINNNKRTYTIDYE